MEFKQEQVGTIDREPSNKILLLDADSITFYASYGLNDAPLSEAIDNFISRVDFIKKRTGCSQMKAFFTIGASNFRYKIYPRYKEDNRKYDNQKPIHVKALKEYCISTFSNCFYNLDCEADDWVVSIYKNNPNDYIIGAIDKDILNCCEGEHYDYLKDKWVTTSYEHSIRAPYIQCLSGDSSDSIKGVKNIGPIKAANIIGNSVDEVEMWNKVVKTFGNEKEAIMNMRLVRCDQWDFNNKLVRLWDPDYLKGVKWI